MPVFALYNFDDAGLAVLDSALGNGAQDGRYINGATSAGGVASLDGIDDLVKIYQDPSFQMDRGTLEIQFTQTAHVGTGPNTILSRDSTGENAGGYRIDVLENGSIQIVHETADGSESFGTPTGFLNPGDEINLTYSWDEGGTGGRLVIENLTAGTSFDAPVPNTLTMDQGTQNQPWIIGAGQTLSNPDLLNNINQHFNGTVELFSISDTVDNNTPQDPTANPDVATTAEDTPVIIPVLANDTDPNGQPLTIDGTPTAPNGTVTVNPNGTITYTPNDDFNGEDTITYTVTDPDGNTSTSTVTVTVTPANDAPEANPDSSTTPFNTPVTFAVLGNDTDVDGDDLAISGTPTSDQGTVAVNADGTLTFTPTAGFIGEAVVNYTIIDEEGLTDTTTWTITVGTAPDRDGIVTGTAGADLIDRAYIDPTDADRVDANDALLPGEVGDDDIIRAGAGNDTILAGTGNDEVEAGDGDDSVNGNEGDDSLLGQAGDDSIFGDVGNDTIIGADGNDEVVGGDGDDVVDGGIGDDALQGNDGADSLTGGLGNDSLLGGLGNDTLTSGAEGTPDRAYPGQYVADLNPDDDRDSVIAGIGDDLVSTGDDDDTILGGDGNDTILAGFDDDSVNGGAGDDSVIAGEGADTVIGEAGNDVVYGGTVTNTGPTDLIDADDLDDENNRDSLVGGAGNDSIFGGDDADTLEGGDDDDLLDGGIDDDSITGGAGNDDILGRQGDDVLDGGAGNDTIAGGTGDDTVTGADGSDVVRGQEGNDLIDTSGGTAPLPDVDYPGLYGADADPLNDLDTVFGGAGDDTIRTGDDADEISGGEGNDSIDAGIDSDLVNAGVGEDTVVGSEGRDTIFGNEDNDLIYGGLGPEFPDAVNIPDATDLRPLNNADSLFGGEGDDTVFGMDDADTLFGGLGNDSLNGGIDNDSIQGDIGNDTIIGGAGNDTMAGGADRDVFIGANANDFIDGNEAGDDFDTMDLTGSGPLRIVYADDNPENGTVTFLDADGNPTGTMNFVNIENVIPCFTPGTMIATPRGEVPVETLRAGDKIVTRDNGLQEIRWVGAKPLTWQEMAVAPHLRPVLVKRGSLGNGLPERDMMVSPNHRLLVANDRTALYFDEHEVLVSAKHLVGSTGIHAVESMQTTYIHFMFDQHEVVLSNGAWTESFQPGDYTLKGMGNAQRNEIFELFPGLKTQEGVEGYTAARKTLKRHEARLLVR